MSGRTRSGSSNKAKTKSGKSSNNTKTKTKTKSNSNKNSTKKNNKKENRDSSSASSSSSREEGGQATKYKAQYKGDINAKWEHGQVVWAKYRNYPWWTGTIDLKDDSNDDDDDDNDSNSSESEEESSNSNNKKSKTKSKAKAKAKSKKKKNNNNNNKTGKKKTNKNKKGKKDKNTICVKWFGDFGSETANCDLINVISFDASKKDEILSEVQNDDINAFEQCFHEAIKVDSERKEELGHKNEKYKKRKDLRNHLKAQKEKNKSNDDEEEEDIDLQVNNSNNNDNKTKSKQKDNNNNNNNNSGKSNRPSFKSPKNKETNPAPPRSDNNNSNKLRRSKRLTKSSTFDDNKNRNENDENDNSNSSRRSARLQESKTEIIGNKKKRKLNESTIDDAINTNEGRNVRSKHNANTNANSNANNNNNSNNNNNDISLRRSRRLNMANYPAINDFGILDSNEHASHWQSSLDMILDVHSAEDLTPFVGLVLHGLMRNSKLSYHNALKYCCDIWDFDLNALDAHMDYFYQDEAKFRRKQRNNNNRR